MQDELKIYFNGEFVPQNEAKVSVFDHGLLYGDGIFEGIRAYNGRVFKLKEHIDRFFDCAKVLMLDIGHTKEEMEKIVLETCRVNNRKDCYIRLVATRGVGDLGLSPDKCPKSTVFCIATTIQLYPEELYKKGIPVITAFQRRNNPSTIDPQIKSLNYLNNILAKIEANRAGVQEAIMLNRDGLVAECTGDNIFIVKNGVIYTPPIHIGALDGITRRTIFEVCDNLGIKIFEKEFSLFNVYSSDECFLSGTAAEAIPVTEADGRIIGTGVAGEITTKILEEFHKIVNNSGAEIF